MISLNQQIEELKRELGQRSRVYPRMVAQKKMRQAEADFHTARMSAALATLEWLQVHSAQVRAIGGFNG